MRTSDALDRAEPHTLAGMLAKAHAAIAEAAGSYGAGDAHHTAGRWAWHLVQDLVRLSREGRA